MIQSWLQTTKLSLNVKKTEYSIIATQYKITHLDHKPYVRINGHFVDRVRTHRYLGVKIDDTLKWHSQIDQIVKKCQLAWQLNLIMARALVPRDSLINICNALVVPYFDYCGPDRKMPFAGDSRSYKNRPTRIITNSDDMTPSSCLLHDLGRDTLEKRRTKQLAITIYKAVNNHFPLRLHELFQTKSQIHTYNLRGSAHSLFISRQLSEAISRKISILSIFIDKSITTKSFTYDLFLVLCLTASRAQKLEHQ